MKTVIDNKSEEWFDKITETLETLDQKIRGESDEVDLENLDLDDTDEDFPEDPDSMDLSIATEITRYQHFGKKKYDLCKPHHKMG